MTPAVAARKLTDETLNGVRRKYELGTATILDVVIAQRDDTARRLSEVDARRQYVDARTNMQQQLGTILDEYKVDLGRSESRQGQARTGFDPSCSSPGAIRRQPAKR